jgi:tellurite resistance-related uncharacterized protein
MHPAHQVGQTSATIHAMSTGAATPSAGDMPAPPEGAREYRRTASFTEATLPAGLLRDHRTKPGVWAKIVVEAGTLELTLEASQRRFLLTPERPGTAPPDEPHHVTIVGPVRFHVEFLK